MRAYLTVLGAVMIIGLIAALLASSWLHRVVSRPMESMANVARQIVEKRDYSFRAEKMTDDEIGVVIDAFNKMLDEVQSHCARARDQREAVSRHRRIHQLRRVGHAMPTAAPSTSATRS